MSCTGSERSLSRASFFAELVDGDPIEGRQRLAETLAMDDSRPPTELRAKALNGIAGLALYLGDTDEARTALEESLAIRRLNGDLRGVAIALDNLGIIAGMSDPAAARSLHEEASAIQRDRGDKVLLATCLSNAGYAAFRQGDYAAARSYDEESLALNRELGNARAAALALDNLGDVESAEGKCASAHARYSEALQIFWEMGDLRLVLQCMEDLAGLAAARARPVCAARLLGFAEGLRDTIGAPGAPSASAQLATHDDAVAKVRSALGAATFEQNWTLGRGWTTEEAITHFLDETEPP